jgi:hypothetical protein
MATDKLPHDRAAVQKAADPHSSAEEKLGVGKDWATIRVTSQEGTEEYEQILQMYTDIGFEVDPSNKSFGTVLRAPIDVARAKKMEWQRLAESRSEGRDKKLKQNLEGGGHKLVSGSMNSAHSVDVADLQAFLENE